MNVDVLKKTDYTLVLQWDKDGVGFGQLTMQWEDSLGMFVLDSELMGIDTVMEIFKNIK